MISEERGFLLGASGPALALGRKRGIEKHLLGLGDGGSQGKGLSVKVKAGKLDHSKKPAHQPSPLVEPVCKQHHQ